MKTVTILEVTKKGSEYGMKIPAGTMANDVEFGLATVINDLSEREKQVNPDFNYEKLLNRLRGLVKCIKQGL